MERGMTMVALTSFSIRWKSSPATVLTSRMQPHMRLLLIRQPISYSLSRRAAAIGQMADTDMVQLFCDDAVHT